MANIHIPPPATLPPLPYDLNALEPFISKDIMHFHHDFHHQAYVDNLNNALEKLSQTTDLNERLVLQSDVDFNGGGHINHSLFWEILAAPSQGGKNATGIGGNPKYAPALVKAISDTFGSLEKFQGWLHKATAGIKGSGWGWLAYNTEIKNLEIVTTPDQVPLQSPRFTIIGIDIWEHAYYLDYKNDKNRYLDCIWNIINYKEAEKRYLEAIKVRKY